LRFEGQIKEGEIMPGAGWESQLSRKIAARYLRWKKVEFKPMSSRLRQLF
jgi:hypothetical protein